MTKDALVRDPGGAQAERFDVIVVGGGVQGAAVALEAARRGARPLLLERSDFGAGTSANTLRILHGGLRYLQSADLKRFRESSGDRRWWALHFPDLVEPLPCAMPLYDRGLHRRVVLGPALALNDLLTAGRNRGVRADRHLPAGRLVGREEAIRAAPMAMREGLRGAALWYDGSMVSPHRLILEMLRWAASLGAVSLNYVSARKLLAVDGAVTGVGATDELTGEEMEFRAAKVVDVAGPWASAIERPPGAGTSFRPALAFNVLLDAPLHSTAAVAVKSRRGPVFFLRPYGGRTLAGTAHLPWSAERGPEARVSEEALRVFLEDLAHAVPAFAPTPDKVLRVLAGLLPAAEAGGSDPARHTVLLDHGAAGGPRGLLSVSPVKFTTAPSVARRVLDTLLPGSRRSADTWEARPARPWRSPEQMERLHASDPAAARAVLREMLEAESVIFLEDLVLRRLDWTLHPSDDGHLGLLEELGGQAELAALVARTAQRSA